MRREHLQLHEHHTITLRGLWWSEEGWGGSGGVRRVRHARGGGNSAAAAAVLRMLVRHCARSAGAH